jgi:hypothetical protein
MNWLNHAVLHVAAVLVRAPDRPGWLAEWKSELWYVLHDCELAHGTALRFCLGSFRDACWVRCNTTAKARQGLGLQSPLRCLTYLAIAAAIAAFFFFRTPGLLDAVLNSARHRSQILFIHGVLIAIAFLVLPTTISLALGEYPSADRSPARAKRFRRRAFLLSKFALIWPIVFFGTLDLTPIIGVPLLADTVLLSYVLAFRWALIDQRRRCPVCLRLLAGPSRFGEASHTLLDWYGTEFFCTRGHGLLHVPENRTSYSTQRWLDLDPSWRSLFSGPM